MGMYRDSPRQLSDAEIIKFRSHINGELEKRPEHVELPVDQYLSSEMEKRRQDQLIFDKRVNDWLNRSKHINIRMALEKHALRYLSLSAEV